MTNRPTHSAFDFSRPSTPSLCGLSGAEIQLITDHANQWIVRKTARDSSGNDRLQLQATKQRALATANVGLRTPAILHQGEIDGRYFFEMEYIRGLDGATFLRQATYAEVTKFVGQINEYICVASKTPAIASNPQPSFFDALFSKLCTVQRTIRCISSQTLAQLFLQLDQVRALKEVSPTLCHGDLTLQNMIVDHEGTIWVVDLLDAPFEHYWQDLAKLHQDLVGGWFLFEQPAVAQCVLDHVSRQLLENTALLNVDYLTIHNLLVALTFVRILPYSRSPEQRDFVLSRIDYFASRGMGELSSINPIQLR